MASMLSAHEFGEGQTILFIHGWELDGKVEALDFEPIFSKTPGYRRVYVDLPGHGKTPADGIKDLSDMLLRLSHFVTTRLANLRFLLVGTSCGAYLARALAQRYADQIDGLLLRVPLVEPRNDLRDVDTFKALVANEHVVSGISNEDKALLGDVLVQTPAYVQALRTKYGDVVKAALKAADSVVLNPIRQDPKRYHISAPATAESQAPKVLAPTLIVCGRHDGVVGYRDALRLLKEYPRSTFTVLDRGGHDLPIDETGLFEALVLDWLTRVDEWRGARKE